MVHVSVRVSWGVHPIVIGASIDQIVAILWLPDGKNKIKFQNDTPPKKVTCFKTNNLI
jgi:hypothetical protein